MSDGRILEYDRAECHLSARHFGEGNVLCSLGYAVDLPCILLREEPLWDNQEEVDGQSEKREETQQRDQAEFKCEVEAVLIALQQRRKTALAKLDFADFTPRSRALP
jgi:hypothetical protein